MEVKLTKDAEKCLDKLPSAKRDKIIDKLILLANNPYLGKKLGGKLKESYSLKVWPYRVIYQINKLQRIVLIVTIEHRQGVYK